MLRPDVNHVDSYLGVDPNYGQWAQYYNDHAPASHRVEPPATEVGHRIGVPAYSHFDASPSEELGRTIFLSR